jgi:hypothetical protein
VSAGIKPLTAWITPEIGSLKPGKTPDICPACASKIKAPRKGTQYYNRAELPVLRKERYARNYVVRCCQHCGKCFYYDNQNKRFIELAFEYKDFFGGEQ